MSVSATVPDGPSPIPTVRMAYLLSQYPAVSHTFFLAEVLGLRARGLEIETASINRPDRPLADLPAREAAEVPRTFYIKNGHPLNLAAQVLGTALRHPVVALRGFGAVLRTPRLTLRARALWIAYLAEALLVGDWMQTRGLRHLHVHFGGPVASVGWLTALAWKLPWSMTVHGPEELLNADAYHLREKLRSTSFVFAISDFCRSQLCHLTPPAFWSRFHVVRLGVDPAVLTPASRRDVSHAPLKLVCTGRLVAAKGHRILLQALDTLQRRGIHFDTLLIGNGPERDDLERFVRTHHLQDSVTFASALSHPETLAHLREADVFVLASFAEGVPVALMEAMSLAIPCISTTVAGIPELIRSGEEGLLIPPANVGALADALDHLAAHEDLRQELGAAGRRRVIRDYNLPLNLERLAQCFTTLCTARVREAAR